MSYCSLLHALSCAVFGANLLVAQCDLGWQSAGQFPGANSVAYTATLWDPDGIGPLSAVAVVGGNFTVIGDAVADRIAAYDPASDHWSAIGGGANGPVRAMLVLPNGNLLVAGSFTSTGGVPAAGIARFDGVSWHPLGLGVAGTCLALAVLPNGDVIVGGQFAMAGIPAQNLARWDGLAWSSFGGANATVRALHVAANGDLLVGGDFTMIGALPASGVARWSAGSWSALGTGSSAPVRSIVELPNGDVVVAGPFAFPGTLPITKVARWNGSVWTSMAAGLGVGAWVEYGQCLAIGSSGQLLLGTEGVGAGFRQWSGTAWQPIISLGLISPGPAAIHDFVQLPSGDFLVAGDFLASSPAAVDRSSRHVVRVVAGLAVGMGSVDLAVRGLAETGTGSVVLRSVMASPSNTTSFKFWQGSAWSSYATTTSPCSAMVGLANGSVMVADSFQFQNPPPPYIPPGWTPTYSYAAARILGSGTGWPVSANPITGTALARAPDGRVLLAWGTVFFGIAYGMTVTTFTSSGSGIGSFGPPQSGLINTLAMKADGRIVVAGNMPATGNIAIGNGTSWASLGSGLAGVASSVVVLRSGDIIAAGDFTTAGGVPANRVARWNGATWSPLGSGLDGPVLALLELPNGDLLAGGSFTTAGGAPAAHIARWNGTTWSPVADGTNAPVHALLLARDGTVWVGGDFTTAGSVGCSYVARLVTPCPATVAPFGLGCVGSGGPNELTATSLPWQGSTFQSRASGMPSAGIVVAVHGFTPLAVPLSQVLPIGAAGCNLLVWPDVLAAFLPAAGQATLSLALPSTSVFIGQTILQQAIPLAFDGAGNPQAMTSTNALLLTIGSL